MSARIFCTALARRCGEPRMRNQVSSSTRCPLCPFLGILITKHIDRSGQITLARSSPTHYHPNERCASGSWSLEMVNAVTGAFEQGGDNGTTPRKAPPRHCKSWEFLERSIERALRDRDTFIGERETGRRVRTGLPTFPKQMGNLIRLSRGLKRSSRVGRSRAH